MNSLAARPVAMSGIMLALSLVCVSALAGEGAGPLAAARPDTVRTNLWLAESLLAEVAAEGVAALPQDGGGVRLQSALDTPAAHLFQTVAAEMLADRGFEVFLDTGEEGVPAPVDYVFGYRVLGVQLDYPEVGRTLGIWRNWVGREVEVSVMLELSEAATGRVLLNRKIDRSYRDRFDDHELGRVESPLYDFTTAEIKGSGWQDRMEEVVVLGTLAGLVAVYFANTSD
ncbi:MAG: hypothetical protein AB7V45_12290 [Candidatus Krumholzibacteriia bacterium]